MTQIHRLCSQHGSYYWFHTETNDEASIWVLNVVCYNYEGYDIMNGLARLRTKIKEKLHFWEKKSAFSIKSFITLQGVPESL